MFYGWVIVALAFLAQFVVAGSMIQCIPVFLLPFTEEFGIGRTEAALPAVVMMICGIPVGPLVGHAVGRFPIRNVMLVGAISMASGCFALAHATEWWQVLALYGAAGPLAMMALGVVSCNSLVVNWFERRRAMALGIAMIGMSISGAVLAPTATWILENWGWRTVYLAMAGAATAMIPIVYALAVTRPADKGLLPDGEPHAESDALQSESSASAPSMSNRDLLGSRLLWLLAAACGLVFFGSMGIMNHGQALGVDRGLSALQASLLISGISVGAACGKLLFGHLADRMGEQGAFYVALAFSLVGLLGLMHFDTQNSLVVCAGVYGLGLGGIAPLQAAVLARGFGVQNFGPAMGLIGPVTIPFQILGPPLAGYVFDTKGSYDLALWIFLGALLLSALAVSFMRLSDESRATSGRPLPAPAGS